MKREKGVSDLVDVLCLAWASGFSHVLHHFSSLERHVRRIKKQHHNHADAVPAVDVGDPNQKHSSNVVYLHLDEILSLVLDQHRYLGADKQGGAHAESGW